MSCSAAPYSSGNVGLPLARRTAGQVNRSMEQMNRGAKASQNDQGPGYRPSPVPHAGAKRQTQSASTRNHWTAKHGLRRF
jgi:hypothetical protein